MPITRIPPTGQREIEFATGNLFKGLGLARQFQALSLQEEQAKAANITKSLLAQFPQILAAQQALQIGQAGVPPPPPGAVEQFGVSPELAQFANLPPTQLEQIVGLRAKTPAPKAAPTFAELGPRLGEQLKRISGATTQAEAKQQVGILEGMLAEVGKPLTPEVKTALTGNPESAGFLTKYSKLFNISTAFAEKLLDEPKAFQKAVRQVAKIEELQKTGLTKEEAITKTLAPTDFKELVTDYVDRVSSGEITIEDVPQAFKVKGKDGLGRTPEEQAAEAVRQFQEAEKIVEGQPPAPTAPGITQAPSPITEAPIGRRVGLTRGKVRIFDNPVDVARAKKLAVLNIEEVEAGEDAKDIFRDTGALPPKSIARKLWVQGRTEALKLSEREQSRVDDTFDGAAMAQDVLELFDAKFTGVSGTGLAIASSRVGEVFRNFGVPPETIRDFATFRNALDATVAPIRNKLFGSALTESEVKRAVNFLTDSIAALEKDPKAASASMLKFYEIVSSKGNRFFGRLNRTKFFAKEHIPTLDEYLASKSDDEIAGFASRGLITPKKAIQIRKLGIGK